MSAALLTQVNSVRLEREKMIEVALDNTMPLHLVCLKYGLSYRDAERLLKVNNSIQNPNFTAGVIKFMRDTVELKVDGIAIQNFLSYRIESDLYTPADAFHLELANPETDIKAGKLCELWINGTKELTGIIDKVSKRINKHTTSLIVEGET